MSQNSAIESGPRSIHELDPAKLGQLLLRLTPAAAAAGHSRVRSTVQDYYTRPTHPEGEFVRDLFTLTAPEVAARWYGGVEAAARIASDGPRIS